MSQIPNPPLSRGPSIEPDDKKTEQITTTKLDEKVQLLDELLERYLHLLDTHQKLQESLGKQLSSVSVTFLPIDLVKTAYVTDFGIRGFSNLRMQIMSRLVEDSARTFTMSG